MATAAGTFQFAVLNDLHYMTVDDRPWLEGLVREVNALPELELVLVLGDLAEDGSWEELSNAGQILSGLRAPFYLVPGNHDGPPGRAIGLGVEGLRDYERLFPGRRNYSFAHRGWQFIGLDTTNGSGYQQLPVPADTKAFAREVGVTLDKAAPTIVFTHMPLNPAIRFSSSEGFALLGSLAGLNLRIVFSGHFHGITESIAPPPLPAHLKMLTNACCSRTRELHDGSTRRGYYVCRANADQSVSHQFIEYRGVA